MNERIRELAEEAGFGLHRDGEIYTSRLEHLPITEDIEKFALLIVYDFLSELSNDDALGEARIATIKRLAKKWGVAK